MGSATYFDRTASEWINLTTFNFGETSFTICYWFYWDNTDSADTSSRVMLDLNATDWTGIVPTTSKFKTTMSSTITSTTNISEDTWYFVAITHDGGGGSGTLRLYLGDTTTMIAEEGNVTVTTPSAIGFELAGYNGGSSFLYDGTLANFQLFTTDLSLAELQELQFKPNAVKRNIYLHLPLNTSSPEIDVSGNGNDGTVNGTPDLVDIGPPIFHPKLQGA